MMFSELSGIRVQKYKLFRIRTLSGRYSRFRLDGVNDVAFANVVGRIRRQDPMIRTLHQLPGVQVNGVECQRDHTALRVNPGGDIHHNVRGIRIRSGNARLIEASVRRHRNRNIPKGDFAHPERANIKARIERVRDDDSPGEGQRI